VVQVFGLDFDEVRSKAESKWNKKLGLIDIQADETTKKKFYTFLYRTMEMPSNVTDYNGEYLGLMDAFIGQKDLRIVQIYLFGIPCVLRIHFIL
jgi:putative alpha-1,2-mannosidase